MTSEFGIVAKLQNLIVAEGLNGLLSQNTENRAQNTDTTTQNYIQVALADPPTDADLAQTIEVQFTPVIQAKATELNHNRVRIFDERRVKKVARHVSEQDRALSSDPNFAHTHHFNNSRQEIVIDQ